MKKFWIYLWVAIGIILGALIKPVGMVLAVDEDVGVVGGEGLSKESDTAKVPEIYIKAVNPGYTVDGVSNVGEMIEIGRLKSDEMTSLAGLTVGYTNSSGNYAVLAEFPEHSFMAGETVLLRLASSPEHELAAVNYAKTLAFKAGPLVLMRGEEVIDSVCWNGKDGCAVAFKSANPTTLARNLETGEFEQVVDYEPKYDEGSYVIEEIAEEDGKGEVVMSQCRGLMFSEILSYYEESQSEQFVEFYNTGAEQILLDGCQIRYKNKLYPLKGVIKPDGYLAWYLTDFSVTKNPTNMNTLELIDTDGEVAHKLEYSNGQKKATAYAWIGYDEKGEEIWRTTYAPTPGEPNNYQEFRTCEEGKVINEATGNCVKVTVVEVKTCPAGQYLNPLTGRCKKIEVATEKTCKEGYYLNEETGRCRKIVENKGADYNLVAETYEEKSSFTALYLVLAVVGVGVVVMIYEFRREIRRLLRKVFRLFH